MAKKRLKFLILEFPAFPKQFDDSLTLAISKLTAKLVANNYIVGVYSRPSLFHPKIIKDELARLGIHFAIMKTNLGLMNAFIWQTDKKHQPCNIPHDKRIIVVIRFNPKESQVTVCYPNEEAIEIAAHVEKIVRQTLGMKEKRKK